MLERNLASLRKHHAQGSDVILETKIKESNIKLTSREKITQAKFKQVMNFIFHKWDNYYFIAPAGILPRRRNPDWGTLVTRAYIKESTYS